MSDVEAVCKECGCILEGYVPVEDVEQAERELRRLRRILAAKERDDRNRLEGAARMPDALKVWNHWLSIFHPEDGHRYKFGTKRKEAILKALGDYTVEELCEAVTGAQFSRWHVENNYTDVATLLSNDKAIDAHRGRYAKAREAGAL